MLMSTASGAIPAGRVPLPRRRIGLRRRYRDAVLAIAIALACAAPSRDAVAANGSALADLTRWIHRAQAQCDRTGQTRCQLITTSTSAARPASQARANGSAGREQRAAAPDRLAPGDPAGLGVRTDASRTAVNTAGEPDR